jgi:hypothetical protein
MATMTEAKKLKDCPFSLDIGVGGYGIFCAIFGYYE